MEGRGRVLANTPEETQRVLLALLEPHGAPQESVEASLGEMMGLVETAGGQIAGWEIQRLRPGYHFIGKGKIEEIEERRRGSDVDAVIFNRDLTPSQQRELENTIRCAVIDRTTLILDIFAGRARTKEAKLQVELAQLQHRLTRLSGKGVDLSRLGGGIGTRGPGLTKLEVDQRRIRDRISCIRQELEVIRRHRGLIRKKRASNNIPVVALVGYTNVGKSSLHHRLSNSGVYADDRLFATLDSTARRVEPADGEAYVLVDTVGFIRDLPPKLVAAFRSTLEEVQVSDILLHVADASSTQLDAEIKVVEDVLDDLGVLGKPKIMAFNKIDLVSLPEELTLFAARYPGSAAVSAQTGAGVENLGLLVQEKIRALREEVEFFIPFDKFRLINVIWNNGRVIAQNEAEGGVHIKAVLAKQHVSRILKELGTG